MNSKNMNLCLMEEDVKYVNNNNNKRFIYYEACGVEAKTDYLCSYGVSCKTIK